MGLTFIRQLVDISSVSSTLTEDLIARDRVVRA